jgi:hypothetical protein
MNPRGISLAMTVAFLLAAVPSLGQSQHAPAPDGESLKAKVEKLIRELDSATPTVQRTAEWELIRLGPAFVPLIPDSPNLSQAAQTRLDAIKATVVELRPRLFSPTGQPISLAAALEQLKGQTGMSLADRRRVRDDAPPKLSLSGGTYWEAIDSLAHQTKSRLSLYQPDGEVALIDGPHRLLPIDRRGAFRIAFKGISTHADLDVGKRTAAVDLELAWEPRFQPFLAEIGRVAVLVAGASNTAADRIDVPAHGPVPIPDRNAREWRITFPAPPRSTQQLQEIAGQFAVIMPHKRLAMDFKQPTMGASHTDPSGVKLELTQILIEADRWSIEAAVDVPAATPALDSFQQWLGSQAWLGQTSCQLSRLVESKREVLRPDPLHTQILSATATRVVVRYQFFAQAGVALKDFPSWRLAFQFPGRLVEITVPFQFRDIGLP